MSRIYEVYLLGKDGAFQSLAIAADRIYQDQAGFITFEKNHEPVAVFNREKIIGCKKTPFSEDPLDDKFGD